MAYYTYSIPHSGYVPPNEYPAYDYPTSTSTSPAPEYDYYRPAQYRTTTTSPETKRHVRTASYTPPKVAGWHAPAGYPFSGHYQAVPDYVSPPQYDHVSRDFAHTKTRTRGFSFFGHGSGIPEGSGNPKRRASVRSQARRIYVDEAEEAYDPRPIYTYVEPQTTPSRPAQHQRTKSRAKADTYFFYNEQVKEDLGKRGHTRTRSSREDPGRQRPVKQEPVYDEEPVDTTPTRSRARRRSSTTTRPKTTPTKPSKSSPEATAADAARHHIPAGYSLKNWDPTEEPILLLGSVFDSNSLGKWIYDWTVYHHKAGSPLTEVAGDLWLLLIKFAGKMKRAEECLPRVRSRGNQGIVRQFHENGLLLFDELKGILKWCEEYMWKVAKQDKGKGTFKMGTQSGVEFVKSIFGRDRQLVKTEQFMASMRLWNMRFDAQCEGILKRPRDA